MAKKQATAQHDQATNGDATEAAAETPKKKETEIETVKMTDGRVIDFAGKKKMLKEGLKLDDGQLAIRIDFRNGETRTYPINSALLDQFATHGAEQKYGDYLAGAKDDQGNPIDVDDMVLELDELHEQLYTRAEWGTKRDASGMAGTSILIRALSEFKGETIAQSKERVKPLSHKEKMLLRLNPRLKPIIERMEAERASKGAKIDTDAILDAPAVEPANVAAAGQA